MEEELNEVLGREDAPPKKRNAEEGQAGSSGAKKPAKEVRSTTLHAIPADPPCCRTA
jgi:hypothetical protein